MKTALVIGGTGPTGKHTVDGLIDRNYRVAILHTGTHEVEFKGAVEHIHKDPHFRETFLEGIGSREFDLVICAYGRLRLSVELLRGRTDRVIAIGSASGAVASRSDSRWGSLGRPAILSEKAAILETDLTRNKFAALIAAAERELFNAHQEGAFNATYIAYPTLYGPRQPAPTDWCIVRRILDKRRHFILADGGYKMESRAYVENAAHATLLAVDNPNVAAGKKYMVADAGTYTIRQRVEAIAARMGHKFEFVDMPYDLAVPCHVLWNHLRERRAIDTSRIRRELHFEDIVSAEDAIDRQLAWLTKQEAGVRGEIENQLGDPFDYAKEDMIIEVWKQWRRNFPRIDYPTTEQSHMYRHPKRPNEAWTRPRNWSMGDQTESAGKAGIDTGGTD